MKTIHVKTKYLDEQGALEFGRYQADNSLSLRLCEVGGFGEYLATATVCIIAYNYTPPEGHVVIKDYSENEGMLECLIAQGVVEPPTKVLLQPDTGVPFAVCKLTPEALMEAMEQEGK